MKILKISLLNFIIFSLFASLTLAENEFVQEAKDYRKRGYEAQQAGDIEMALVYYKKATALDPYYAIPHNDLAIAYEMKGYLDKALEEYKTAIRIDPSFAEAHMNLALLYERMGDIEKAITHFAKRVEYGEADSAWTKKAWEKLWQYSPQDAKEVEARILAQEVAIKMKGDKESNKIVAEKHFQKGTFYFKKQLYENAYEELKQCIMLVPDNQKYKDMYEQANAKYRTEKITLHYKNGIDFLNSNENVKAKQEFEKILELVPRE